MARFTVSFLFVVAFVCTASSQTWVKVNGLDDEVRSLTVFNNLIYGGGLFTTSNGQPLQYVGVYGGRTWEAVGSGFDGNVNAVYALGGEQLFAAGSFTHSGATSVGPVARWNGTAWVSTGAGISGEVYCLGEFNGTLYAGGNFFVQDSIYGLAKWDGERWLPEGASFDNAVYAFGGIAGHMVVGGDFTFIGTEYFSHLAQWDGSTWSSVGSGDEAGISGVVRSMLVFHDKLIVAGGIDRAGTVPVRNIAGWNGTAWSALGSGVNGICRALASSDSSLFVGGTFTEAGGVAAQNIAVWADSAWGNLSLGTAGPVNACVTTGTGLFAGGVFSTAGGLPANNFGRWSSTANVTAVVAYVFRDKDGKYNTMADRTPKSWSLKLYRDSISSGTLVTSSTGTSLATSVNRAGLYILAEADSGADWSRIGPRTMLADTFQVMLNTTVLDTFVNFHINASIGVSMAEGWNLVSSPLEIGDNLVTSVFPNAASSLFQYTAAGGYRSTPTIENGPGYWLKFNASAVDTLFGSEVNAVTIPVHPGWNIIGSITSTVPVASVVVAPAGILRSQYYSYSNAYAVATTLAPGRGYWIKSSAEGTITLNKPASQNSQTTHVAISDVTDNITVTDADGKSQSIYLASGVVPVQGMDVSEIPPPPPAGGYYVRIARTSSDATNNLLSRELEISGGRYPLTILWNMGSGRGYEWVSDEGHGDRVTLRGSGKVTVESPLGQYRLVSTGSTMNVRPTSFALAANYPNPFNPSTSISVTLPQSGIVTLIIYDQLGREVDRLADQNSLVSGEYTFAWQAGARASGVYYYRATIIDAATGALLFQGSHAMLLVK